MTVHRNGGKLSNKSYNHDDAAATSAADDNDVDEDGRQVNIHHANSRPDKYYFLIINKNRYEANNSVRRKKSNADPRWFCAMVLSRHRPANGAINSTPQQQSGR